MSVLDISMDGSPLPVLIALDIDGNVEEIEFDIICPVCGWNKYIVSMDKGFLSCAKCQTMIGKRNENYFGEVEWRI